MSRNFEPVTITLDRGLLEHPTALHIRRMRSALWLYLVLLARLPRGSNVLDVKPRETAEDIGLPEGTVRSWLGHLRKARYIEFERLNGSSRVTIRRADTKPEPKPLPPLRPFTLPRLVRALGEKGNRETLEAVLGQYPDDAIRQALARTLAVPTDKIRRSRTALFVFLLKRYAEKNPTHPRH
jgi:hypothetical protein